MPSINIYDLLFTNKYRFTTFDIIPSSMHDFDKSFEERYAILLDTVPDDHAFVISFGYFSCSLFHGFHIIVEQN